MHPVSHIILDRRSQNTSKQTMFFMDKWEHCFSYLSQTSGCTVVLAKYLFGAFCIYSVTFYSVDQTKERIYEVLIRDRKADISITLRNSLFYFVEIFHLLPHLRRMFLSRKFYNNITNTFDISLLSLINILVRIEIYLSI